MGESGAPLEGSTGQPPVILRATRRSPARGPPPHSGYPWGGTWCHREPPADGGALPALDGVGGPLHRSGRSDAPA